MKIMKRWFALMLTISLAFSDCGGISVFAAEDAIAVETPDSENQEESSQNGEDENTISDEMSSEQEFVSEEGPENSEDTGALPESSEEDKDASVSETEISALHIGQIKEGEKFPEPDDSEFVYDLPVSFEMSDSVILFVHYDTDEIDHSDTAIEKEENKINEESENGTLVWSILRGKNGLKEGSASLVNEKDDWLGFEVVSDSTYFTMTENEEEGNAYYKTVKLVPRDTIEDDGYNYYIRAAYYFGTEEEKNEEFYAAATIPFLPGKDADLDEMHDDALGEEESDMDRTQDEALDAEGSDADKTQDEELLEEESDIDEILEDADIEGADTENVDAEDVLAYKTNEEVSVLSEGDDTQQHSKESPGVLTLNAESVTLHSGGYFRVSATIESKEILEDISESILWESSDTKVAYVYGNGMDADIYAVGAGAAQITAECSGIKATVRVEVVEKDESEIHDLSDDIWIAGFQKESEDFVYTGNKITQDIRVYHKETLLKEKTDYTLSYKNNVNAAAYNTLKAPSVTITFKGQYSGSVTLYYTIKPANINDIDIYNTAQGNVNGDGTDQDNTNADNTEAKGSSGYEQAVTYSKTLKIPNPELSYGKKKLTANKDFVCDYTTLPQPYKNGDSYEAGTVYNYVVNGKGNYTGSFQMRLVVVKDKNLNFSSASVTLDKKQYEYHGTALPKSEVTIEKLILNKSELDKSYYDYEVCTETPENAYVMVYPTDAGKKAGYRGYKKLSLKLVGDRNIGAAALGDNWKNEITFSQKMVNEEGGIFQKKTDVLTFGTGTEKAALKEGEDYTVKYSNAKKVGTVTVTFIGKGRYKGTLKKTYKITPNIDKNNFTIGWKNVTRGSNGLETAYQKGGAVPDFVLKDQDNNILKNKTDYTVKLKDNKTPGTLMSCEINGKGNYKGYIETVQIMVTKGDISRATISVSDKPFSTKPDAWKSKPTIKDVNGKTLTMGKDYEAPEYIYENPQEQEGQAKPYPVAGATVYFTVKGINDYEGSQTPEDPQNPKYKDKYSYRIFANNISKLKVTIDPQEYTGKEIKLSSDDIHVYANNTDQNKKQNELRTLCYEIIGYSNNIKAGTAKVTLRGVGDYGGTKTYSFKIQKKQYGINRVKGITLDKTSLVLSIEEDTKNLTATITPNGSGTVKNPTVVWSSSNSNIATVENGTINGNKATGTITFIKAGSVTITATTQDGNKKAQCKITIENVPLLKESGQTIKGEAGDTYQLGFEEIKHSDTATDGFDWVSSNEDVVSVDKNGLMTFNQIGAVIIKMYSRDRKYVQKCYAVVEGKEVLPEGKNYLTYEQKSGTTDDTAAINNLIEQASKGDYDGVYIPAGVYWINPDRNHIKSIQIRDKSNLDLIMSPGALIMAIPNNLTNYCVIWVEDSKGITISGGTILGERKEHMGTGGEAGHGIAVWDSEDIHISNMDISQCWGDGIYLASEDQDWKIDINATCKNITITDCILHENRRSNLSIVAADDVEIEHCEFNYAKGTNPQYGIDIETNNSQNPCERITISNSTFKGNAKGSMGIITPAKDITLENCNLDGTLYNMAGKNVVLKNTKVKEVVDPNNEVKR